MIMAMSYGEWSRKIGGTRERYQDYLRGLAEAARLANNPPATGNEAFKKIEFDWITPSRIGSIPVVIGQLKRTETTAPVVFAAALSENDLRRESCGYGTTESEAAADLFRLMRP